MASADSNFSIKFHHQDSYPFFKAHANKIQRAGEDSLDQDLVNQIYTRVLCLGTVRQQIVNRLQVDEKFKKNINRLIELGDSATIIGKGYINLEQNKNDYNAFKVQLVYQSNVTNKVFFHELINHIQCDYFPGEQGFYYDRERMGISYDHTLGKDYRNSFLQKIHFGLRKLKSLYFGHGEKAFFYPIGNHQIYLNGNEIVIDRFDGDMLNDRLELIDKQVLDIAFY